MDRQERLSGNKAEDLAEQANKLDPVFGTPLLDVMSKVDAPTPRDGCACFVERVRANVRQRRTKGQVAKRVANNASLPLTEAFESELTERVQDNIERRLD